MSVYTAIIGDTSSVGARATNQDPSANADAGTRRNPAVAAARIRSLQNPHIVSDSVGGFISADFTIPPEEAQLWRPVLRYGAVCWLFDGHTPIFHGWLEKPTWGVDGSALVNVSGAWILLGRALMREAWDLWDMTLLTKGTGANENKAGQFNVNSDGTATFSFPNGTVIAASDRVSVDYLLFGEAVGAQDAKLITAFEFNISDAAGTALTTNRRIRVLGKVNAATAAGDLLYDTGATGASGIQGASNINGTNQAGAWVSSDGYRCLRIEYIYTVGVTVTADQYVTFDRIRFSTRENMFPAAGGTMDTGAIARDLFQLKGQGAAIPTRWDIPQEFWLSSQPASVGTDLNTLVYANGGLDPRIPFSSCPNSGVGATGFSALEWQSPADILAALAAIDARHIGFYLPYNQRGGYDPAGQYSVSAAGAHGDVGSWWLSAQPTLFYQAFSDPAYNPDYTVQTQEGAQVEQNTDTQPLIDVEYVNYQTLRGRQLSQVVVDADTRNYLYAQGFRRAEDYTVQPTLGDSSSPAALGLQNLAQRRQPHQAATITIQNDGTGRSPILKRGASVPKLATIRPGSLRITDVPAGSGLRSGIATHVEWWGQTDQEPEHVTLTLGVPGQPSGQAIHLGKLIHGEHRRRKSIF